MIFEIINCKVRESKLSQIDYYAFTLLNGDNEKFFAYLVPFDHLLDKFHKKNGIYWGDKEPFAKDYIGFIISAEWKWEQYKNKLYKRVILI